MNAELYDLEACARKFRGVPDGDYVGKDTPTLVTAEALANNLGLDAANGPDYVRAIFTPYVVPETPVAEEVSEAPVVEEVPVVEEPVVVEEPKKK